MDNETLWLFIKVITLLPLILVMAYLTIKYGLSRAGGAAMGSKYMRRVDHLPLGPKAGLTLVEIGGRYYLVACQENHVTLLKEFDALPEQINTSGIGTDSAVHFKEVLSQQFKQTQQYLAGRRQGKGGSGCQGSDQQDKK
ncbi:flagellar biosynthetic protein FliO [Desulfotomaculum sp. 1211_IL3151]|uniref:flagellar biosynthetic protein FliO n=1 Tax=Desulfotomaculum sp. 1211_IL3151 TaxID=3084055 RepID=UPI002FD888E6